MVQLVYSNSSLLKASCLCHHVLRAGLRESQWVMSTISSWPRKLAAHFSFSVGGMHTSKLLNLTKTTMVDKKSTKKAPARRRGKKGEEKGLHKRTNDKAPLSINTKAATPSQHAGTLLITLTEDAPTWFSCARQTPGRDDSLATHPSGSNTDSASLVAQYRAQADELYKRELQAFHHSKTNTNKDEEWVENTMKRGTLKDRIAAMSVIVSTDPVHKLHALDGLLNMATNPNTRMAQMAAEALQDLFLTNLASTESQTTVTPSTTLAFIQR